MGKTDRVVRMEHARHELLADISAHAAALLRDHGIDGEIADHAGISLANHLAEHWGGQVVSIPRDYFFKLAERDMQIYGEFRGNNYDALARKYKLTTRAVYKLIDRVHKRLVDQRQGKLFG